MGWAARVAVDVAGVRVVLPRLGREVRGQLTRRGTLMADARIDVKKMKTQRPLKFAGQFVKTAVGPRRSIAGLHDTRQGGLREASPGLVAPDRRHETREDGM